MFKATQTLFKTNQNKHQIKLNRKRRALQKYQEERRAEWYRKWHPKPEARWMHKRWWKETVSVQRFAAYMNEKAKYQDLARKRIQKEFAKFEEENKPSATFVKGRLKETPKAKANAAQTV